MVAQAKNLVIEAGSAGKLTFKCTDLAGNPLDVSAYGMRAAIRTSYDDPAVLLAFGIGTGITKGPDANEFSIAWTSTQATTLAAAITTCGGGVWDLFFDPAGTPDASSYKLVKGRVVSDPSVTRLP
jgi:hypothetical protein